MSKFLFQTAIKSLVGNGFDVVIFAGSRLLPKEHQGLGEKLKLFGDLFINSSLRSKYLFAGYQLTAMRFAAGQIFERVCPKSRSFRSDIVRGALFGVFINPLDYVRLLHFGDKGIINISSQTGNKKFNGEIGTLIDKTYITEGGPQFYRGVFSGVLKESISSVINGFLVRNTLLRNHPFVLNNVWFLANCAITFPLDIVKFRMITDGLRKESQYKNCVDCAIKTYRSGGLKSFYPNLDLVITKGLVLNLLTGLFCVASCKGKKIHKK